MDKLKKLEKDGHHSLDDTRVQSEKLQELTDATIKEIDEHARRQGTRDHAGLNGVW